MFFVSFIPLLSYFPYFYFLYFSHCYSPAQSETISSQPAAGCLATGYSRCGPLLIQAFLYVHRPSVGQNKIFTFSDKHGGTDKTKTYTVIGGETQAENIDFLHVQVGVWLAIHATKHLGWHILGVTDIFKKFRMRLCTAAAEIS